MKTKQATEVKIIYSESKTLRIIYKTALRQQFGGKNSSSFMSSF